MDAHFGVFGSEKHDLDLPLRCRAPCPCRTNTRGRPCWQRGRPPARPRRGGQTELQIVLFRNQTKMSLHWATCSPTAGWPDVQDVVSECVGKFDGSSASATETSLVSADSETVRALFPLAIVAAGPQHIIDSALQASLEPLQWWNEWQTTAKVVSQKAGKRNESSNLKQIRGLSSGQAQRERRARKQSNMQDEPDRAGQIRRPLARGVTMELGSWPPSDENNLFDRRTPDGTGVFDHATFFSAHLLPLAA